MSQKHDPAFAPIPRKQAEELEWTINQAARKGEVVVIDPDSGVTESKPSSLIASQSSTKGLTRFGEHYRAVTA